MTPNYNDSMNNLGGPPTRDIGNTRYVGTYFCPHCRQRLGIVVQFDDTPEAGRERKEPEIAMLRYLGEWHTYEGECPNCEKDINGHFEALLPKML